MYNEHDLNQPRSQGHLEMALEMEMALETRLDLNDLFLLNYLLLDMSYDTAQECFSSDLFSYFLVPNLVPTRLLTSNSLESRCWKRLCHSAVCVVG